MDVTKSYLLGLQTSHSLEERLQVKQSPTFDLTDAEARVDFGRAIFGILAVVLEQVAKTRDPTRVHADRLRRVCDGL